MCLLVQQESRCRHVSFFLVETTKGMLWGIVGVEYFMFSVVAQAPTVS